VYVSWFAAKAYCQWASGGGLQVRLPTEAEREYACRAGSNGWCCFGDDESRLKDYAWYRDNSGNSTHPVGQKNANGLEFFSPSCCVDLLGFRLVVSAKAPK